MATAAAHVAGSLPSTYSGRSTEELKRWWVENIGDIRNRYARALPILKEYCMLLSTSPYLIFGRKRACGCSPGANRSEAADSPAGILWLHQSCMRQRGVVPEMADLARVYDRFCNGEPFNANHFADLLRTYLIRETHCEIRNAFGKVVERSGMCTRGPVSQLRVHVISIVPHRYAQIGANKAKGVFVGATGRAEIMEQRDRFVRRTMAAFGLWLPEAVADRTPCLLIFSAGAYANPRDLSATPKRLLVAAVVPMCQADILARTWGRFDSPYGGVITCCLCAHFGFAPRADSGARFAAKGNYGSAAACFQLKKGSKSSSYYGGSLLVGPASPELQAAAAAAAHPSMFGTMDITRRVAEAILATDRSLLGGDATILKDIKRGGQYFDVFTPSV